MANMMNLGWAYYKDYYRDANARSFFMSQTYKNLIQDEKDKKSKGFVKNEKEAAKHKEAVMQHFEDKNKAILEGARFDVSTAALFQVSPADAPTSARLSTGYPGFMTGTGIPHETGLLGEFKIGFAFDFTTGMPYLPGSSVKGLLRSAFPQRQNARLKLSETYHAGREKLLRHLLTEAETLDNGTENAPILNGLEQFQTRLDAFLQNAGYTSVEDPFQHLYFELLCRSIFNGETLPTRRENAALVPFPGIAALQPLGTYRRDLFFDAYICASDYKRASETDPNAPGRLLETDFITPHINRKNRELDAFTNPVPLQLLKVPQQVRFQFQWRLQDDGLLRAAEKQALFLRILRTMGAGAKTNSGYGNLL